MTSPDRRTIRASATRATKKAALLQAAAQTFASKGYHQTRISDVIECAGVARGTFYLYFESKTALFLELLDLLLIELRAAIVGVDVTSHISVEDQLSHTVRNILAAVVDNRNLTTIVVREAACVDAETDLRMARFYRRIVDYICCSLLEGQKLGLIAPDIDTDVASMCILGTFRQFMERVARSKTPSQMEVDQIAREMLQFNLGGIRARSGTLLTNR
ncbi:MAG: helix-turn-helix domain-containing protein [Myxococcota bacterium]